MSITRRATAGMLLLLLLSGLYAIPAAPAQAADAKSEIAYLIGFVRHSDCIFIRNGSEYSGADAADHVQEKYDYYKNEIVTAEDFIDKAASRSEFSGKAYAVRCPGQAIEPSAAWLRRELEAYRKHAS